MPSVLEAAKLVLEETNRPLPVRELTSAMLSKGYWQTQGLTPEATVQARLATDIKNRGDASSFVRTAPGTFALKGVSMGLPQLEGGQSPSLFEEEELDPAANTDTMSFTDAAIEVLQEFAPSRPMHYRDITRIVLDRKLVSTRGKTPEATMYAQILTEIDRYKHRGLQPRFQKLGQGMVALTGDGAHVEMPPTWSTEDEALLQRIKDIQADQFERLVAKLLTQMYDGADIQATPLTKDAGVDARGSILLKGSISLELVAQAKKFSNQNVRRPDIQCFRGSMGTQSLGVFITTHGYSRGAVEEAARSSAVHPIGLINGKALIGLMKEHQLGLDSQGEPILLNE